VQGGHPGRFPLTAEEPSAPTPQSLVGYPQNRTRLFHRLIATLDNRSGVAPLGGRGLAVGVSGGFALVRH
jgi:hypothetical protein